MWILFLFCLVGVDATTKQPQVVQCILNKDLNTTQHNDCIRESDALWFCLVDDPTLYTAVHCENATATYLAVSIEKIEKGLKDIEPYLQQQRECNAHVWCRWTSTPIGRVDIFLMFLMISVVGLHVWYGIRTLYRCYVQSKLQQQQPL